MRLLLALLVVLVPWCDENPLAPSVPLDTPFMITLGQTVKLAPDQTKIRFARVVSDSRCPMDVRCFWEGEAVIQLEVSPPGSEAGTVDLTIRGYVARDNPTAHLSTTAFGCVFTFMELTPYPDTRVRIPAGPTTAMIRISRPIP